MKAQEIVEIFKNNIRIDACLAQGVCNKFTCNGCPHNDEEDYTALNMNPSGKLSKRGRYQLGVIDTLDYKGLEIIFCRICYGDGKGKPCEIKRKNCITLQEIIKEVKGFGFKKVIG